MKIISIFNNSFKHVTSDITWIVEKVKRAQCIRKTVICYLSLASLRFKGLCAHDTYDILTLVVLVGNCNGKCQAAELDIAC